MIQIEEVHIEHVRGIRDLTLTMNRKSFAIHGPNGSGKSGVVDAIEFALTGDISRLSGRGTGGLSVKTHGPHVDVRGYPDRALVRLRVFLTRLRKSVTITRKLKSPNKVEMDTEDADVSAELAEISRHPEVTLTRRQIASFILTEAGNRAKEVQALLRLEAIDQIRASLKSAQRTAADGLKSAQASRGVAEDALRRHLDIAELSPGEILSLVNRRRRTLGAEPLDVWSDKTVFSEGLPAGGVAAALDKASSVRDLETLRKKLEDDGDAVQSELLAAIAELASDADLRIAIQRKAFVEQGLQLVEDPVCPLCDTAWSVEDLKEHLRHKLKRADTAQAAELRLTTLAGALRISVQELRTLLAEGIRLARALGCKEHEARFRKWDEEFVVLHAELQTVDGILRQESRLQRGWKVLAAEDSKALTEVEARVRALPDLSEQNAARSFLVLADERLQKLSEAERDLGRRTATSAAASACHAAYNKAAEEVLEALYSDVQKEFAGAYRAINNDDEAEFSAALQPQGNKLQLSVDFHKRGQFPPGAYHSEGHQDGMGLCLYLALMRQLLDGDFRFAVLDDVVMSVDKQHRRELCSMLRERYPEVQFVITTHEQAWFHQMQQAGLVERGSAVTFRNWTVEDGPRTSLAKDAWDEIADALEADDVPSAAWRLRRYLEYVAGELADGFVADVPFRLDADHDLGQLLPKATSRFARLLKKGVEAAKHWKDSEAEKWAKARSDEFAARLAKSNVENWAVNKAVHYNSWAEFSKEDFEPVVAAYRELLDCMRCAQCNAWFAVTPRSSNADALRCKCGRMSVNLARR